MSVRDDHRKFKKNVRECIKKNFKKYLNYDHIIGRREDEKIKIPIPSIEIPKFKYGEQQQGGVGQGSGDTGETAEVGEGQSRAGNQPGEQTFDVDISIEELADILGEALELPRIEPRGHRNIESHQKKYTGRSSVGPDGLRHFKTSYKETLKRSIVSGTYKPENPFVVPIRRDFRYRSVKKTFTPQFNAVVIYIMDVSGSMGDEQKQIVRLESFWINTWLRRHYKGIENRFIIHDASANEVDESAFFSTTKSGGTLISSGYKLCQEIIKKDYPPNEWNVYVFHFSDGDNWSGEDTKICVEIIKDFFLPQINMFGYGQVDSKYGSGQFLKDLERIFPDDNRITMSRIENKEKIAQSIKQFLGKGK